MIAIIITFTSIDSLAQASKEGNLILTNLVAENEIGKWAQIGLGWLMALVVIVLYLIAILLSVTFKFLGQLMYGFFVNNPLDTELGSIRPLWSFLVDFGNLVVIGSFIALAIVYLFGIEIAGIKKQSNLGQFFTGIMLIALLMNFSLTFTSAFATTVHNIGIGSVFATLSTKDTQLNTSSKAEFQKSIRDTGSKFFESINNNFVESVSCMGSADVVLADKTVRNMAQICEFHKQDSKETLNPQTLLTASDGTPEAFKFYLIALVREVMVIILLGVAIGVIITLLRVSIFRIAYLWMVGIFAGPALVAAVSPFGNLRKYFAIWLKWLITFSTMMIVFVYGFYLSSYIAQLPVDNKVSKFETLPSVFENFQGFVTGFVNTMIGIILPNIMFPIIGLAILSLLGKYLDETYKEHADKAMKAGGKLINDARNSTTSAIKGTVGGASNLAKGGLKNVARVSNLRAGVGNLRGSALSRLSTAGALGAGAVGLKGTAQSLNAASTKFAGAASVRRQIAQKRSEGIKNLTEGKAFKDKQATADYLGQRNNAAILGKLGLSTKDMEAEAKKRGVSNDVIIQGRAISYNALNTDIPGIGSYKKQLNDNEKRFINAEYSKPGKKDEYDNRFKNTQNKLLDENVKALKKNKSLYDSKIKEYDELKKTKLNGYNKQYEEKLAEIKENKEGLTTDQLNKKAEKLRETTDRSVLQTESNHKTQMEEAENQRKRAEEQLKEIQKQILTTKNGDVKELNENNQIVNVRDKDGNNLNKGENTLVVNMVNNQILEERPEIKEKAAIMAFKSLTNNNKQETISNRITAAKSTQENLDNSANAIFERLKAIDSDNEKASSIKQKEREALMASIPDDDKEILRKAKSKFEDFKSNSFEISEK